MLDTSGVPGHKAASAWEVVGSTSGLLPDLPV